MVYIDEDVNWLVEDENKFYKVDDIKGRVKVGDEYINKVDVTDV